MHTEEQLQEIEDTAAEHIDSTTNAEEQDIKEDIAIRLQGELAEQKDKYLRLFAEFENFKKRTAKERLELFKTAGADVIKELLSVLDDFDRAERSLDTATDIDAVKQGLILIKDKLTKTLQNKGLQPMESLHAVFDAEQHEAITEIPAPTDDAKGKVLDVLEKGYVLNDKIIRYAKVVVGK